MDGIAATAVATVIAAGIGALAAWATGRSAARAQVIAAATSSRSDLEQQAFDRAKGFYTDVIDRQAGEIRDLEGDVDRLKGEVSQLRTELARAREDLDHARTELQDTRAELNAARAVLQLRYPDEP